ncbi:FtsQ-type POTRA domain-containing protein [Lacicoccus alkaliphilus]|nr:FtsQ-type POTRA domain-containing protein [Salinicoccus alkaliphilus]
MKDNEEVSKLRKKLESSRNDGQKTSIESRLYGSREAGDLAQEEAGPIKPKVQDFSTLKKENRSEAPEEDGPRIIADYTKEGGEGRSGAVPADETEPVKPEALGSPYFNKEDVGTAEAPASEQETEPIKPESPPLKQEDEGASEEGPRILADYTKEGGGEHPGKEEADEPGAKGEPLPEQVEETSGRSPAVKPPSKPKKEKQPRRHTKFTALKENILSIPKYIIIAALLFLILSGTLFWYVFTDASDLKQINISGNDIITEEEIKSRLGFGTGDKMYSISTGTAEENIGLLPIIVEVDVEREWWNDVNVTLREHRAVGYVENEGSYNPLLENARILRGYQVTPSAGPLIHYFEGEEMDRLVANLNDIEPDILAGISEIYYRPSENSMTRIHILMNDGQEIVADYRDFGEKMNHYVGMREAIGPEEEGIIDIEIGSSFLPYDSAEARHIKEGIHNSPEASGYVNEVNASMDSIKQVLNEFDAPEDE